MSSLAANLSTRRTLFFVGDVAPNAQWTVYTRHNQSANILTNPTTNSLPSSNFYNLSTCTLVQMMIMFIINSSRQIC